jgi:hypothetical protein
MKLFLQAIFKEEQRKIVERAERCSGSPGKIEIEALQLLPPQRVSLSLTYYVHGPGKE